MTGLTIAETRVSPGHKAVVTLRVATMASGAILGIPVHVIVGQKPGPTLALVATQHGEELGPLSAFRALIQQLDPNVLAGAVLLVPVANPIAFEHQQRSTWVETARGGSTGNLNRLWPGNPRGFITERIAYVLTEHVVARSDCVIDFHGSTIGGVSLYYSYLMPQSGSELARRCKDLVLAFGMEIIMARTDPGAVGPQKGSLSLSDYVYHELQRPTFPVELGDFFGFDDDPAQSGPQRTVPEVGLTGALNVMRALGMLHGAMALPNKQVIVHPETRCQPSHGGLLEPLVTRRHIGKVFPKGTSFARVVSPYTFDVLDEIQAPFEQSLLVSASDSYPFQRVNPGDQGFHVADYTTAQWIINEQVSGRRRT